MNSSVSNTPAPARGLAVAVALAAVYLIWGSTYLGIRFALEGGYPPLLMAGGRFLLAGTMMFAVLRMRGERAPTRAQWKNMALMGLLMMGIGNGMVSIAEQWVSSGLAAVAIASTPLWMGLFSLIRGQRPSGLEWVGIAIGFVGVLWLNAGSTLSATPAGLGGAADRADRLGVRIDLEQGSRPSFAFHVRGRADADGRLDDAARRLRHRRKFPRHADAEGHAFGRLPDDLRLHHRLHRLRVAAAPRAPHARG